ncbi:MAG: hypothetical protein A4E55_01788 [Pelotomaculum sp. PtaU1.Bin035]|nr:MAG: hypothetical protein A4E55_01788 [Pelotomaculum sp. PtaU1.Bin035]
MKRKVLFFLSFLILVIFLEGCSLIENQGLDKDVSPKTETVTTNVMFRSITPSPPYTPISGVTILVIGTEGEVIEKLITNGQGEAQKSITIPIDKQFPIGDKYLNPRGTVTVIAFKEGYRETVLFEVGISDADSTQPVNMYLIVPGERNEPNVELGINHHLEISSLVDKYAKITK